MPGDGGQPEFEWLGPSAGRIARKRDAIANGDFDEGSNFAEKFVGADNLRPIAFLERGVQLASAVVSVTVPGSGTGTGFLISRDVLLTNHHVLTSASAAAQAIIRFNYQDALDGEELPVVATRCDPNSGFATSPYSSSVSPDHLDFTVVRIAEPLGDRFGFIPLFPEEQLDPPIDVVIIQHPDGGKKKIAIADNQLVFADSLRCQYVTDTTPGSSGSPVFNDRWELIALHHAGGRYVTPDFPEGVLRNEGILISALLTKLPEWATTA